MLALLVGPILGEATPHLPLYLAEALLVELAALGFARRPLALGAVSGVADRDRRLRRRVGLVAARVAAAVDGDILPEGLMLAVLGGVAGGAFGALLATGLRGELARPPVAPPVAAGALAAIARLRRPTAWSSTTPDPRPATVALVDRRPRRRPGARSPDIADGAAWATVTGWQGKTNCTSSRCARVGPGVYRVSQPMPVTGSWKTMVRSRTAARSCPRPCACRATPRSRPEVPAPTAERSRAFVADARVLQREQKPAVPGWLKTVAPLVVLLIALAFAAALAWGVARIGRRAPVSRPPAPRPRAASPRTAATPLPH